MKKSILTTSFAALALCLGAAGARAQSQAELNREACAQYKVADDELNRTYALVLKEYKADAAFVESMRAAQRAWLAYRDAHLEAMYPGRDKGLTYGSAHPMCRCYALAEVTRERT
ncbi:MAG TPA: lysozyme inhibitor LprI family protein, partial [Pyrinomonadaceae bacterium]